ncbi:MAG: VanZ family protein [Burkholderiaceae bacterium]
MVVLDASLYPFLRWRDLGIAPFDYLFAAWPPHPLPFDLVTNILGYLPLGFVAGLALHPRCRGPLLVIGAVAYCALLSAGIEAVQTYLPARVASKVDLLSNVAGGLLGALLAARFAPPLLDTGRLRVWRARWFASDASRGLVLIAVWFGALVYPEAFALGTGGLLKAFDPEWSESIALAAGLANVDHPDSTAAQFQLAESIVCALALLGAGLLFLNLQRATTRWSKRVSLLFAFIVATIAVKAFAHAFLFADAGRWPLLGPGARWGLLVGSAALMVAWLLPMRLRWALGLAALTGSVVLVNILPDNPYASPVGLAFTRGRLMNFYGLAKGLNLAWPYFVIAYYLRHREPHRR